MRTPTVLLLLSLLGCAAQTAPELERRLRDVGTTSTRDLEAVSAAEAVRKQLDEWAEEAVRLRREGEPLAADSPWVDGRAEAGIERLRLEISASAQSPELAETIVTLADAHQRRAAILAAGPKFREKAYHAADRKATEVGFALRHWRARR